jgi:Uma2 family endonuclease
MAASGLSKKPATYEDLQRIPEHLVAELVGGELYATPRPAVRHAHAATILATEIVNPFNHGRGGPGGWWILAEPELHLRRDVIVPDIAGWRRSRLAVLPDTAALSLAPDWVCEVISPSTEGLDRGKKVAVYAREKVSHVWLINPQSETLEVLVLVSGRWTLLATHVGALVVRAEPFDAVEIDLSLLWPSDPGTARRGNSVDRTSTE